MDKDIEALITALYVKIDDEYGGIRDFGRPPKLSASELLRLAVAQALHASHSRFFWGLRLYLVCTPAGMPVKWALANVKMGSTA